MDIYKILRKTYKDWGNQRQAGNSSAGKRYAKNLDRLGTFLYEHGCPSEVRWELCGNFENIQTYGRLFLALLAVESALKKENIRIALLDKKQDVACDNPEAKKIDQKIAALDQENSEYAYLTSELTTLKRTLEDQGIILDSALNFLHAREALLKGPDITGDVCEQSAQQLSFITLNRLWNEALEESCESENPAYQSHLQTGISRIQHPLIVVDRMCHVLSQSDSSSESSATEKSPLLSSQNTKPSFRKSLERTLARNGLDFTMLKKSRKAAIGTKAQTSKGNWVSGLAGVTAGFFGLLVGAVTGPILGIMMVIKNGDCGMEGLELVLGAGLGLIGGPFIGAYMFGKAAMEGVKAGKIKEKLSQAQQALGNNQEAEAVACLTDINCVTQQSVTGDTWPQRKPDQRQIPSLSRRRISADSQQNLPCPVNDPPPYNFRQGNIQESYAVARNVGIVSNAGAQGAVEAVVVAESLAVPSMSHNV